jgi:small subunit ribosomal protein S21
MIIVKVVNGNIEKALREFKKKCLNTKLLSEIRERQFFKKPSVIKREKLNKAKYVQKKYKNYE